MRERWAGEGGVRGEERKGEGEGVERRERRVKGEGEERRSGKKKHNMLQYIESTNAILHNVGRT